MSVPPDFEDALGESLDVIDRELAKDEVPLRERPLRAARDFVTYCVMQVAVGEEITEPGKFLDYMASDWFKAIYARTIGWYTARYGQAVKSGSGKSHTGCILVLDTPFAMRIPVVTKRPGQPGETIWVCFPMQVEDDEDPLEWIVDGPNVRELPRSDGLKARRQAIEIANAVRAIVTSIMAIELTHTNDEVRALNEAARVRLRASDQLGKDVTLNVERGSRDFAAGDRIMFLKNERSLGVKNGSLGIIRSVSPTNMAVMLDDGRSVAFDLKDYSQLDHGYAATIHKAQGMTVDRVHVLATPGLDRHGAYVALSRHRDQVDLHYGSDDFADRTRLVRTLGRDRGKDMVADYTRTADGDYPQQRRRAMFDGFELKPQKTLLEREGARAAAPTPSHVRGMAPDRQASDTSPVGAERSSPPPDLAPAVERHGKILSAMRFARSVGESYTPDQRLELAQSRAALDALRPDACRDLEQAMVNAPRLITEAAQGKTQAALRAMQLEAEMRTDPVLRADVFVQRWQALDRQRRSLLKDHESSRANRVAETMIGMARSLERDPQLESLLRQRRSQLGLPELPTRSMGQSLSDMVGRGRSRGIEIGM